MKKKSLSASLGALCTLTFVIPGSTVLAQTDSVEITFDEKPIERGLSFDRTGVSPTTIKFGETQSAAWVARQSLEPSQNWTRSFRFKITDPKFQNAARPSVDVELTYHMPASAGWALKADTKNGGAQVGNGWGNTTGWRTEKLRLDDAYFGARDSKSSEKMSVDGFDLRLDSFTGDFWLKNIKITGFDPKENVDWSRMTKIGALETNTPGGIFVFNRARKHEIRANLQNMALVARPLFYKFDVAGYDDKARHTSSGALTLGADKTQTLPLAFDSSAWPLGPYDAKLSLFLDKDDKTPLYERNFRMGIVSNAVLPKAREGEFLFGLDAANTYIYDTQDKNGFAFYQMMGVDILRDLHRKGDEPQDVAAIGRSLARLSAENMRGMLMIDPPKDADEARRNEETAKTAARLEEIARLYAGRGVGQIRFFELGNEPDLRGFYPNSMADYIRSFAAMRAAIKRSAAAKGLKPQDTVVMNGGLSFAGPEGEARSREFLQIVDQSLLDAIAYHGHGKGGESERANLGRARDAAQKGGKNGVPFIETESGFSGNDRNGLMEQARTAVEKMTYAQAEGMETFIFFRLFMEGDGTEGGYGMTDNRSEPRPSALAYRNMVERLRHHRFVKNLEFAKALEAPGLNAHLFEERDAKGAPTGRKTFVAWSETPSQFNLSLRLDARGGTVSGAQNFDLFGNATPTKVLAGNVASIPVGSEPVFVTWQSGGKTELVDVAPALLTIRADEPILVGATTRLPVLARNPESKNQAAEIRVKAFARVPITATVSPAKLTLRGDGEAVNSQIAVNIAPSDTPLALPTWWKVFTDVDAAKLTPEVLNSVPQNVAGAANPVAGQWFSSQEFAGGQRLELAKLAGGFGEKRAALAVTTLDAPRDMILLVAASADWWMQWSVNGETVYSTLDRGNAHGGLADHVFDLPLKKGRNILSALTLSGSGGWKLEFGGPKERGLALTSGTDPDRLEVSLVAGGKTVSTQIVPLQIAAPIPAISGVPTDMAGWMETQPLAVLGAQNVSNFFVTEPEQVRWYKGETDLSALIWARDDGQNLQFAVSVSDDQHVPAPAGADAKTFDSLQVLLRDESGKILVDETLSAVATRENGRTFYRLSVPKARVGSAPFRLSLSVNDNDSNFLKQKLTLTEGAGMRLRLR